MENKKNRLQLSQRRKTVDIELITPRSQSIQQIQFMIGIHFDDNEF